MNALSPHPLPARQHGDSPARRPLGRAALGVGVLWALAAVAGWVGGQLWWLWWSPGPDGAVYDTSRGLVWLPEPLEAGFAEFFSATGQYVVIGLGLGLLLGLIAPLVCRGRELLGLTGVLVAAIVGAFVMYAVGIELSPPDPQGLAEEAGAGAELPAAIGISGWTPFLAWPVGALFGFLTVMVMAPVPTRPTSTQPAPPPPPVWAASGPPH